MNHSTLNWLVIGIGDITTKRVIPAILSEPRSHFHAVLTRTPAKADAWPGTPAFTSLEDALADPTIDAVYVASPVAFHASHAIACLKAGRHVLSEKPVAMNFGEAESMAAAARESGKLLGISYYRRLFPNVLRARQLISEGAIGQPLLGEAKCHGWLESEERGWLRDRALAGGGPLYDTGSHRIDLFNFLFGKPVRATGLLSNALHSLPVEDSATALIEYENNARAIVDVRWNSRIVRDEVRVTGTTGEIVLAPLSGPALSIAGKTENHPVHPNVHFPLVENFVDAVLRGEPPACPIEAAIPTDWVTEQVVRCNPRT